MSRVISALFLITAVVVFWQWTMPYWNDVKILSNEKTAFDESLTNSRQLQTIRDDLLSKYNGISQENLGRLDKLFPSSFDPASIIMMLEDRSASRGMFLKRIDAKETDKPDSATSALGIPAPPYKTISLVFSVSGPYSSFIGLISDLEKSLRLVDIQSVAFSSAATDVYEFNVEAKTYYASPLSKISVSEGGAIDAREISNLLSKLKSTKIDLDFFKGSVFQSLVEFAAAIQMPAQTGRPNPFIPLGAK